MQSNNIPFPDQALKDRLYGRYLRIHAGQAGWRPLWPEEYFGSKEFDNELPKRLWQTVGLRYTQRVSDAGQQYDLSYGLSAIIVGPAETEEQAACLVTRHEDVCYEEGRITYLGMARLSELIPAPDLTSTENEEEEEE